MPFYQLVTLQVEREPNQQTTAGMLIGIARQDLLEHKQSPLALAVGSDHPIADQQTTKPGALIRVFRHEFQVTTQESDRLFQMILIFGPVRLPQQCLSDPPRLQIVRQRHSGAQQGQAS